MPDTWSGKATNKFITKHCGLTELLDEGDNAKVEFRFDFPDFLSRKITVNMHPTLEQEAQTQFTLHDVDETQQIASVPIYIECAIGQLNFLFFRLNFAYDYICACCTSDHSHL